MLTLNYDVEIKSFNERNEELIKTISPLNDAIEDVTGQIIPKTRTDRVIYGLGMICIRHYEAIVLLCLNGFGFRAMSVLRSFFENSVDSVYLRFNPSELNNFTEYSLVSLIKSGFEDAAKIRDSNYIATTQKFKNKNGKWRSSWSTTPIKKRAESSGFPQFIIKYAYDETNQYVHSSIMELEDLFNKASDGTFTLTLSENTNEGKLADVAFSLATGMLVEVLKNQLSHFKISNNNYLDKYEKIIEDYFDSLKT